MLFRSKNNNEMTSILIDKYCKLDRKCVELTSRIFEKYQLTNRSYTKLIKTSRTIADLDGSENINSEHIIEAFSYRKAFYKYFN